MRQGTIASHDSLGRISWKDFALLEEARIEPAQFYDDAPVDSGERRLCLALLADALRLATGGGSASHKIRSVRLDALAWIASEAERPFSVRDVCFHLRIDLATVRAFVASGRVLPRLHPTQVTKKSRIVQRRIAS